MSSNNSISVTLGCDPQTIVTISETDTGTLFVIVASADPTMPVDLDGVFFNLSDDSTLDSLNFFPDANAGSIYSPVTGVQAAVNGVDTLANGAQVADGYDVGIQFGTVADSPRRCQSGQLYPLLGQRRDEPVRSGHQQLCHSCRQRWRQWSGSDGG